MKTEASVSHSEVIVEKLRKVRPKNNFGVWFVAVYRAWAV